MWLAYLDETGNTGTNLLDTSQSIHFNAAVLIAEDQLQSVFARQQGEGPTDSAGPSKSGATKALTLELAVANPLSAAVSLLHQDCQRTGFHLMLAATYINS